MDLRLVLAVALVLVGCQLAVTFRLVVRSSVRDRGRSDDAATAVGHGVGHGVGRQIVGCVGHLRRPDAAGHSVVSSD